MITSTDRNEDIRLDLEEIPKGYYLHAGLLLQQRAKSAGIAFGVAKERKPLPGNPKQWRLATVGLIIRNSDRERMTKAAERPAKTTGKGKP